MPPPDKTHQGPFTASESSSSSLARQQVFLDVSTGPSPPPCLIASSSCADLIASAARTLRFSPSSSAHAALCLSFILPWPTLLNRQDKAQALPPPGRCPGSTFPPSVPDTLRCPCPRLMGYSCVFSLKVIPCGHLSLAVGLTPFLLWPLGCSEAHLRVYRVYVPLQSHLPLAVSHDLEPTYFLLTPLHFLILSFSPLSGCRKPSPGPSMQNETGTKTRTKKLQKSTDFYESNYITNRSSIFPERQ